MPSATRKTKTNSGKAVSSPAKSKTCRKASALTPSAAAKDSTTVAMSISGATTARSSAARMSITTTRISGMSSSLSRAEARSASSCTAVPPPTFASAPGIACSSVAHPVHGVLGGLAVGPVGEGGLQVDPAVLDRGHPGRRADGRGHHALGRGESPAHLAGTVGVRDDDHGLAAAGGEVAALHLLADHGVGGVGEAGRPATGRARSARGRPKPSAPSTSTVGTHTARGLRSIRAPIRDHSPVRVGSGLPRCGTVGQNTQRPKITSSAGKRVIMASRAMATPMAATGPRPEVEFISAASRHSMLSATVAALAMIAGPARCRASAIASCRSSWRRSSSR